MLRYIRTNILTSDAQTIVNTVNTVGVMGKGLAAEFKKRYPAMFHRYVDLCEQGALEVGKLWLWKGDDQWVLNFPTKKHWRNPSKLEYIEAGLEKFVDTYEERGISEIAFPRLGCGNGGLDWKVVQPLMENYLGRVGIPVYIHDFEVTVGRPEHEVAKSDQVRTFSQFLEDVRRAVVNNENRFTTFANQSDFSVRVSGKDVEDFSLEIERSGGRISSLSSEDLLAVWCGLSMGPVTRSSLGGKLFSEAYYVLPLLSAIPYIRPIEVHKKDEMPAFGVILKKSHRAEDALLSQK